MKKNDDLPSDELVDDKHNNLAEQLVDLKITVVELENTVAGLEENRELYREFLGEANAYIEDLKSELADIKYMRLVAVGITFILIFLLVSLIAWLVVYPPAWFEGEEKSALQFALILSAGAGAVLLLAIILRGLFRTRADRHYDGGMLPENIRILIETAQRSNQI